MLVNRTPCKVYDKIGLCFPGFLGKVQRVPLRARVWFRFCCGAVGGLSLTQDLQHPRLKAYMLS